MNKILYTELDSPVGNIIVAATDKGICKISIPASGDVEEDFFTWIKKHFPGYEMEKVNNEAITGTKEIKEYFDKKLKDFSVPIDLRGTPFQLKVWEILRTIPYGEIRTYKEIAQKAGNPSASRGVGAANRANPVSIVVPCHRVIGSDGTMKGYGGKKGIPVKEFLLRFEGYLK